MSIIKKPPAHATIDIERLNVSLKTKKAMLWVTTISIQHCVRDS